MKAGAAVRTTEAISASFHNGMEYFNTFGGNTLSCAAGLAMLEVLEKEGLQERALEVCVDAAHRFCDGTGNFSDLQEFAAR